MSVLQFSRRFNVLHLYFNGKVNYIIQGKVKVLTNSSFTSGKIQMTFEIQFDCVGKVSFSKKRKPELLMVVQLFLS